ncbi:hypothetical protein D9611_004067 [Ephemerocybe angulata]|uniref:F-box domain-containing protein n=1 Tax=Ephemerocybe angulata TaxID=980116 RepID=A0A8H5BJZ6_9AGAR|nr:hypothetical protein D9611_004067 [Tulosesus angulatus]
MTEFPQEKLKLTEDGERIYQNQEKRMDRLKASKARLLEELSKIESAMADLVQERRELLYSASPISSCPNEILSMVFHQLQRAWRADTDKDITQIAEVTVSHVCSHWRRVALSLPALWCGFQYSGVFYDPGQPAEERLAAYLERSGQHPFDLWIDLGKADSMDGGRISQMLTAVLPHLHRFRVLQLLSNKRQCLDRFRESLATASVPLLEACAICPDSENTDGNVPPLTLPNIFQNGAPSLKYVRLDETSLFNIRPPLDTVVQLRIERRKEVSQSWLPNTILDDILSLPNLETLSLFGDLFHLQNDAGSTPEKPILARNLKHIRSTGTFPTIYLFSHVLAPSLESITLSGLEDQDGEEISTSSLAGIADHAAFPSLRIVALTKEWIGFPNDLQALQIIMSTSEKVEELIFWEGPEYTTPEDIFRALVGTNGMPSSWAKIKKATLSMPFSDSEEIGYYHQFIQANPDLEVLRVPPGCLQKATFVEGVPSHINIQAIDDSEPPLPLCWLPGPGWLDTEEDPFLADCRVYT